VARGSATDHELAVGDPIGLIEVMKTFGRVLYQPDDTLLTRARVVRVLAADGAEVNPGDALLEIEPA
jgi:biotin carboxyl carrier protein